MTRRDAITACRCTWTAGDSPTGRVLDLIALAAYVVTFLVVVLILALAADWVWLQWRVQEMERLTTAGVVTLDAPAAEVDALRRDTEALREETRALRDAMTALRERLESER